MSDDAPTLGVVSGVQHISAAEAKAVEFGPIDAQAQALLAEAKTVDEPMVQRMAEVLTQALATQQRPTIAQTVIDLRARLAMLKPPAAQALQQQQIPVHHVNQTPTPMPGAVSVQHLGRMGFDNAGVQVQHFGGRPQAAVGVPVVPNIATPQPAAESPTDFKAIRARIDYFRDLEFVSVATLEVLDDLQAHLAEDIAHFLRPKTVRPTEDPKG